MVCVLGTHLGSRDISRQGYREAGAVGPCSIFVAQLVGPRPTYMRNALLCACAVGNAMLLKRSVQS
eukprot:6883820-Pyramimonas_sp.AAC.1